MARERYLVDSRVVEQVPQGRVLHGRDVIVTRLLQENRNGDLMASPDQVSGSSIDGRHTRHTGSMRRNTLLAI
jgi:hypothetical protein